eukprot:1594-Heterococcus_DN1.PRE.1
MSLHISQLRGELFFGSAVHVLAEVREHLGLEADTPAPPQQSSQKHNAAAWLSGSQNCLHLFASRMYSNMHHSQHRCCSSTCCYSNAAVSTTTTATRLCTTMKHTHSINDIINQEHRCSSSNCGCCSNARAGQRICARPQQRLVDAAHHASKAAATDSSSSVSYITALMHIQIEHCCRTVEVTFGAVAQHNTFCTDVFIHPVA